jgi:Dyp-type peroxidase family
MDKSDEQDVQGLFFGGYPKLSAACYLVAEFGNAEGGKAWLASVLNEIATGPYGGQSLCLNVALSAEGLQRLGLDRDLLRQFALEFQEGMVTEHRKRILGDHGSSDPGHWAWGGHPEKNRPDLLVLVYAKDSPSREGAVQKLRQELALQRIRLHTEIFTTPSMMSTRKEHFGFHDGISQPTVTDGPDSSPNSTRRGEFLLGHRNEYGLYPTSPIAPLHLDPKDLLSHHSPGGRDFGRNGSYLVFRQLRQDVRRFWEYMDENAARMGTGPIQEARVRLASQCVGRWPSGAPLATSPEKDNPDQQDKNGFTYAKGPHPDPHGVRCPLGSHVRRTNPRDALNDDPAQSISLVKRHRILRRGRSYGEPVSPEKILGASKDVVEADRGLCFICLNADISRQFEFIQQTWINNPKFAGLYNDADPLMGDHYPAGSGQFTIQKEKVSDRVAGLSRFVDVEGGGYFFMPALRALKYLAALPPFVAGVPSPARPAEGKAP